MNPVWLLCLQPVFAFLGSFLAVLVFNHFDKESKCPS